MYRNISINYGYIDMNYLNFYKKNDLKPIVN